MNRERAKELLPAITAFAEGRSVQFCDPYAGEWHDVDDDLLIESDFKFRMKPEPREFTLHLDCLGRPVDISRLSGVIKETIRVREVLDD